MEISRDGNGDEISRDGDGVPKGWATYEIRHESGVVEILQMSPEGFANSYGPRGFVKLPQPEPSILKPGVTSMHGTLEYVDEHGGDDQKMNDVD